MAWDPSGPSTILIVFRVNGCTQCTGLVTDIMLLLHFLMCWLPQLHVGVSLHFKVTIQSKKYILNLLTNYSVKCKGLELENSLSCMAINFVFVLLSSL